MIVDNLRCYEGVLTLRTPTNTFFEIELDEISTFLIFNRRSLLFCDITTTLGEVVLCEFSNATMLYDIFSEYIRFHKLRQYARRVFHSSIEEQVYEYCINHIRRHNITPTMTTIAENVTRRSDRTISRAIYNMVDRGIFTRDDNLYQCKFTPISPYKLTFLISQDK